jgi:hypothetical protein
MCKHARLELVSIQKILAEYVLKKSGDAGRRYYIHLEFRAGHYSRDLT